MAVTKFKIHQLPMNVHVQLFFSILKKIFTIRLSEFVLKIAVVLSDYTITRFSYEQNCS